MDPLTIALIGTAVAGTAASHYGNQAGATAMANAAAAEARRQSQMSENRAALLREYVGRIGGGAIDASGRAQANEDARVSGAVAENYSSNTGKVGRGLAGRIGKHAKRSSAQKAQADAIGLGRSRLIGKTARIGSDLAAQDLISQISAAASQSAIQAASHTGSELRLLGQIGQGVGQAGLMYSANQPS